MKIRSLQIDGWTGGRSLEDNRQSQVVRNLIMHIQYTVHMIVKVLGLPRASLQPSDRKR